MLSFLAPSAGSEDLPVTLLVRLPSADPVMASYILSLMYLSDPFWTLLMLSAEQEFGEAQPSFGWPLLPGAEAQFNCHDYHIDK